MKPKYSHIILVILLLCCINAKAQEGTDTLYIIDEFESVDLANEPLPIDTGFIAALAPLQSKGKLPSLYEMPASWKTKAPDWHRMWINTAVLCGAYVSALFVLELLPEDATNWSRAKYKEHPFYERWYQNVFVKGPEWDGDKFIFNYVLHPYAGAAYFMSARSCGFNFGQSLLYSACISTFGWEYGIEACMERPSIQDLFVTPLVGSIIGEGFYRIKHHIVGEGYRLWGSPVLGNIVVFLVDPVNEVINLFRGSDTRKLHLDRRRKAGVTSSLMPVTTRDYFGFSFNCTF